MRPSSDRYLSHESTDIDDHIEILLRAMSAAHEIHTSLNFPMLPKSTFGYDKGKAYSRIWTDNGTQRFVCFFVERATGDVWKAAGWKGPTKNFVRGNIMTQEGVTAITLGRITDSGYWYYGF